MSIQKQIVRRKLNYFVSTLTFPLAEFIWGRNCHAPKVFISVFMWPNNRSPLDIWEIPEPPLIDFYFILFLNALVLLFNQLHFMYSHLNLERLQHRPRRTVGLTMSISEDKGQSATKDLRCVFVPPANEVWGKIICLQVCVCPQGGAWSRGECLIPVGCLVPGGCLVLGGAWWRPLRDGYCCGRYASY